MPLEGSVLAPEKEAELEAEDDAGEESFEGSADGEVEEGGGESEARLQIKLNMTYAKCGYTLI